jgi:CheY-like chemotaxis protein
MCAKQAGLSHNNLNLGASMTTSDGEAEASKLPNLILPIGFSSLEKSTIESFFRLASHKAPHWRVTVHASEASVILFNAASQQDFDVFKSLVTKWQRVILVGASDFDSGWPVMSRPLKLTSVLHLLNEPLASYKLAKEPAITNNLTVITNNVTPIFNVQYEMGKVLLVDDSDIALKYLNHRINHYGYEADTAKSGEDALIMLESYDYKFVFLDVMMPGLDGYKTCKAIKSKKSRLSSAPIVVMLTSRGGTIDKIRGSMAGCDAYMTKPLNEKRLSEVLNKFDGVSLAQRDTLLRAQPDARIQAKIGA